MSSELKPIKCALISVYHKTGLSELATHLSNSGVRILATGGTYDHIKKMGLEVTAVDEITEYPSILGGRVKTLHPKVFGGILNRRDNESDRADCDKYAIPEIDLVVVDLYPFSDTLQAGGSESEIIEKIDIGGVSLLRAAAKNFRFVSVLSSFRQYQGLMGQMVSNNGCTDLEYRRSLAASAFETTAAYDRMIGYWTLTGESDPIAFPTGKGKALRYGENPHQKGIYFGDLDDVFTQLSGKELSYNNLLDVDAAISLAGEFSDPMAAVIKHNNACGVACGPDAYSNWVNALESDPVSAFGGIIILTSTVDERLAGEIGKLFFEVLIAPDYTPNALQLLMAKKNRIILKINNMPGQQGLVRSVLNGILWQSADSAKETASDLRTVTIQKPDAAQISDLLFANKIVKHSRSNTIVLAKNNRLIAAGVGQTSRVDALNQAIEKAQRFGLSLEGAVMASDAFFPFPDCVDIADKAGIKAVIQPGGSVKDQDSIDRCNASAISMVFTGIRHFKH